MEIDLYEYTYKRNHIIYKEGDEAKYLYFVKSGIIEVKLIKTF